MVTTIGFEVFDFVKMVMTMTMTMRKKTAMTPLPLFSFFPLLLLCSHY